LKQCHVKNAIELLKIQVGSTKYNYRSLDFEIIRRENSLDAITPEDFYNSYIKNDICFNYPHLFSSISYSVPKGDGGVRKFHFLETHLRILYYSLGFYFIDLTKDVRTELKGIQHRSFIYTHYGADINLASLGKSDIDYKKDYQKFTGKIRKTARNAIKDGKVAVLHLDIQDFFHSIEHSLLTQMLREQALPEAQLRLQYNEQTRLIIREVLFLIMQSSEGLPISQHNIISNLLSHLFLHHLDCYIREIQLELGSSSLLTYHRYVDDIFITIKFSIEESNQNIGTQMLDISTRIGEYLSTSLGLSLNPLKTRLDIISSEDEVNSLIERSRLVSFYQPLPDEGGEPPQQILSRAVEILTKLKDEYKEKGYVSRLATNDDLALKQCFQNAVIKYTDIEDVKKKLEKVLQDFPPALIPKSMKVLVFLISRVPIVLNSLIEHVSANLCNLRPSLTTLYLAENLMLIEHYQKELDEKIIEIHTKYSNSYIHLLRRLVSPNKPSINRYINIENCELEQYRNITYQIRCSVIAEKREFYGTAYNHLLNTLQEWCFVHRESNNEKSRNQYNCKDVIKWLEPFADHSDIIFVMTMFDRRNRNTISHPGAEGIEIATIDKSEYKQHLERLNLFFTKIYPRLPRININE
jgi:Reverse transcriptase (RNA-dependent DNA polymerase)